MKQPKANLEENEKELLEKFEKFNSKGITISDVKELSKTLGYPEENNYKLNNSNMINGAGYQTAHQVNSALNTHDASKYAHPNKIEGIGVTKIEVTTTPGDDETTLYINPETKEIRLGKIIIIK